VFPHPTESTLSPRRLAASMIGLTLLALTGCAGPFGGQPVQPSPWAVREEVSQTLPINLPDRDGWARDIQVAFTTLNIPPRRENICAVLAVVEHQSDYQLAPSNPQLPRLARTEIDERAASSRVPAFIINAALNLRSATGETYNERLDSVRTERELNAIFDDFIERVPLGSQLFGNLSPVQTGGPMRVDLKIAETYLDVYPYPLEGKPGDEVFTRRGGLFFGTAHLLGYPTDYDETVHRFADYRAGRYASRNAAFQDAVARLTGIDLDLDGHLIRPGSREPGETELAVRSLAKQLRLDHQQIRESLEQGDALEFANTRLYNRVLRMAGRMEGREVPRAIAPRTRQSAIGEKAGLSPELFAKQVSEHYQQCIARASLKAAAVQP
jgi:hypothetical protein